MQNIIDKCFDKSNSMEHIPYYTIIGLCME